MGNIDTIHVKCVHFLPPSPQLFWLCAPVSFLPVPTYTGNCFAFASDVMLFLHPPILCTDASQHLSSCPFPSCIVWLCSGPHSFQDVELFEGFKKNLEGRTWPTEVGLRRWGCQEPGLWSVCPVSKPPPHIHLQGWTTPPCFPFLDGLFWDCEQE